MKQYKNNKTNTLVRSQKRQKKRRKGSSYKEEKEKEDDKEDDDDDDDVKVDDWQRRYFSDTIIIDISCLHYIQQITQFLILH